MINTPCILCVVSSLNLFHNDTILIENPFRNSTAVPTVSLEAFDLILATLPGVLPWAFVSCSATKAWLSPRNEILIKPWRFQFIKSTNKLWTVQPGINVHVHLIIKIVLYMACLLVPLEWSMSSIHQNSGHNTSLQWMWVWEWDYSIHIRCFIPMHVSLGMTLIHA